MAMNGPVVLFLGQPLVLFYFTEMYQSIYILALLYSVFPLYKFPHCPAYKNRISDQIAVLFLQAGIWQPVAEFLYKKNIEQHLWFSVGCKL